MIARSFLGTLAALAVVHAVEQGQIAFAWWIGVGVVGAAALELVAGLVRRKLGQPSGPPSRRA